MTWRHMNELGVGARSHSVLSQKVDSNLGVAHEGLDKYTGFRLEFAL